MQRPSPTAPRAPSHSLRLEPCEWRGVAGRVECGTLRVPEDRDRPGGRALSLFFLVVRATGNAAAEPVFFFTGGPGTAASASAGELSAALTALRETRDFVFIDQRGTGRSAPLACDGLLGLRRRLRPIFDRAETAACRDALARDADLRRYTTADAVPDVDDVRMALGYRRVTLHGSSYGTRAAWEYAARYPNRARAMVLQGPAPPDLVIPLPFARALDAALAGLVEACADDDACAARFPRLDADIARAFERLRAAPASVRVADARSGGPAVQATLAYGEFAEAVRYLLYTPAGAARLPSLITSAANGDYSPIANAAVDRRGALARGIAQGMYLSVTCAEDIPRITPETTSAATGGTRLGDYRVRQQLDACRAWPPARDASVRRSGAPASAPDADGALASAPDADGALAGDPDADGALAGHPAPRDPDRLVGDADAGGTRASGVLASRPLAIPALVQVGEFDPATPVEAGRRALDLLPNGHLVIVPHGGHGFGGLGVDACLSSMVTTFLTRASARGLDTSCVAAARRPPFDLR